MRFGTQLKCIQVACDCVPKIPVYSAEAEKIDKDGEMRFIDCNAHAPVYNQIRADAVNAQIE